MLWPSSSNRVSQWSGLYVVESFGNKKLYLWLSFQGQEWIFKLHILHILCFSLSPFHHSSSWSCALCMCCLGLSGSSGVPAIGGICCGSSSGSVLSSSWACWKKLCFTQNTRASVTKETTVGWFNILACLWNKVFSLFSYTLTCL